MLSFKSTPRYVTLHLVIAYTFPVFKLLLLQLCKYDIEQSISREMSGDLKAGMLTIGWFYSLNRNIISKIKLFLPFGFICIMQTNVSSIATVFSLTVVSWFRQFHPLSICSMNSLFMYGWSYDHWVGMCVMFSTTPQWNVFVISQVILLRDCIHRWRYLWLCERESWKRAEVWDMRDDRDGWWTGGGVRGE